MPTTINPSGQTITQYNTLVGAASNLITNVTPGAQGSYLMSAGASANPAYSVTNMGFYGDGSDGAQTFDGAATILGLVPAANVYTLNRDIFLASSTINNGVFILCNGFKILCNGTLTNNGTIYWNGNDGTALGVGGAARTNSNSTYTPSGNIGLAGGAGNIGAGSAGSGGSSYNTFGGAGGAGGLGSSGAGGAAGAVMALTPKRGSIRSLPQAAIPGQFENNTVVWPISCGTGGGGGGGDGVNKGGGGGGGAGAVIVIAFLIAGTGTISANGGAGGSTTLGNTGGGGGGGGGLVIIISRSVVSGAVSGQTITVSAGNFGTKTGTGVNGSPGNIGVTILLPH